MAETSTTKKSPPGSKAGHSRSAGPNGFSSTGLSVPATSAARAGGFLGGIHRKEAHGPVNDSFEKEQEPNALQVLQPKLTINPPGDIYEQEADRMTTHVMRMSATNEATPTISRMHVGYSPVQRMCSECAKEQEEKKEGLIQTKAPMGDPHHPSDDLSRRLQNREGSGTSLPDNVQAKMEQGFDTDFGGVRVHTDSEAAQMNRELNAQAFTHGSDIYFNSGNYQPGSAAGDRLLGHELTHVVQQNTPDIQKFEGTAHERAADVTGINQIDLGNNVILTWGEMVALAGDYYASIENLRSDTQTEEGKKKIRAALEHYDAPRAVARMTGLPEPEDKQKNDVLINNYLKFALENIPHFVQGGTAWQTWNDYHARAVHLALLAGLGSDDMNEAYILEAFGQHFLTDSFAAGHIRTPRNEINDWYSGTFGPQVFNHFLDYLKEKVEDQVFDQVWDQVSGWYKSGAAIGGGLIGGWGLRKYVRRKIRSAINSKIDTGFAAAGGRDIVIEIFGKILGGIVSRALHDIEGTRNLWVNSPEHPEPWQAPGDSALFSGTLGANTTVEEMQKAIIAALEDLHLAYEIGCEEREKHRTVPAPTDLPAAIYFGFNEADLNPATMHILSQVYSFLTYNPDQDLELIGHTDPIGSDLYNYFLGDSRAGNVESHLLTQGVAASRLSHRSESESQLVTSNPRQYWKNRRVELKFTTNNLGMCVDVAYEKALERLANEIGPPYRAEGFLPEAVPGLNDPIPPWRWGSLSDEVKDEIRSFLQGKLSSYQGKLLDFDMVKTPMTVEGYTVDLRSIVESILNSISDDPVKFLEKALGEKA